MVRSKKDLIEIILCSLIIPEILFIAQELGRIDIAKDVIAKIKSMKELKYVKYEDVQINPNKEEGIG